MIMSRGITHPGKVRLHNEDALLTADELGLYVVADGMGGERAGEVASHMAVETIRGFVARSRPDADHTWPFGIDGTLGLSGNLLRTAVKLANRTIFKESACRPQLSGMGTTIAALLMEEADVSLCGIGDSRVYSILDGDITQLTRDHTWVQTLLAQTPGLDPSSLAHHPMRHVLTSVVGAQADVDVPIIQRTLVDGETLMLCSDGVHGAMTHEQMRQIIVSAASLEAAAQRLVSAALDAGGRDNISALVVKYRTT